MLPHLGENGPTKDDQPYGKEHSIPAETQAPRLEDDRINRPSNYAKHRSLESLTDGENRIPIDIWGVIIEKISASNST